MWSILCHIFPPVCVLRLFRFFRPNIGNRFLANGVHLYLQSEYYGKTFNYREHDQPQSRYIGSPIPRYTGNRTVPFIPVRMISDLEKKKHFQEFSRIRLRVSFLVKEFRWREDKEDNDYSDDCD